MMPKPPATQPTSMIDQIATAIAKADHANFGTDPAR
jgi:hypothetical protein